MDFIHDRGAYYRYLYEECHCVNAYQDQETRRIKYTLARGLGSSREWAVRLRDWRLNTFAKHFGFKTWAELMVEVENRAGETEPEEAVLV